MDVSSYQKDHAFKYEELPLETVSWWDRFWARFWHIIGKLFSNKGGDIFFNWVVPAIAIVILVFFIVKFLGIGKSSFFSKNGNDALAYQLNDENIHELDFKAAISKAIANNNYRLAIRLLYLQTLKQLTDNGLIDWRINKTNATYVSELTGNLYQNNFIQLTNYFDRVWYGENKISEQQFAEAAQLFYQFQQQIPS